MYPKVTIHLDAILENLHRIQKLCKERNITLSVVTKLFADNKEIVTALVKNGATRICESRIQNFISYHDLPAEKWLIRAPMLSEVDDVVKYSDVSLNSEIVTIKALNTAAQKQGKIHKVILMYELGDLREGCLEEELHELFSQCLKFENIKLYGIGTNLSCYGEIIPTTKNMNEFAKVIQKIENKFKIHLEVVSGGNSSSYQLLANSTLPKEINNLRFGEAIYFGTVPCIEEEIPDLNHHNFVLKAQIIELKEKPSVPWGEFGKSNSFGEHFDFVDRGTRKRAIIGIGRQDVKLNGITPIDEDLIILGGSSDHIIVDVTDSHKQYKVGDIIEFNMNYSAVLYTMTSKYVEKEIEI